MTTSQRTTDHETIRRWAEERGGKPAAVSDTQRSGDDPGLIRLYFPFGGKPEGLTDISWDDWFEKFDSSNLALLYQETTADGQKSNFNKLVSRSEE